ncbi:MAG: hypothetical protein CMJ64_00305 [Planctomycetaceae bacterium]|nr:hypothetical protein [Planctomycetaceae bacterium]
MLSFLAFSLLAVEKSHGTDDIIAPSHDPSECVVCPLAHGPSSQCASLQSADLLCAEYSDYDYNDYRHDEDPAPAPPQPVGLDAPDTATDDEYFAEYDWYGEDVVDDSEESVAPDPLASDKSAAMDTDVSSDLDDLFDDSFEDDAYSADENAEAMVDEFGDAESYEALAEGDHPDTEVEYEDVEYYSGYESYEDVAEAEDWVNDVDAEALAREAEALATENDSEVIDCFEGYDSYEEFMQAEEAAAIAIDEASIPAVEDADVESEWAGEEYGYYGDYEENIEEYEFDASQVAASTDSIDLAAEESLQTGYDDAYDDAMNSEESEVPAAVEDSSTDESETIYDEYESFYDAYDGLYNFEADENDYTDADRHLGPVIAEFEAAETTSLEELAADVIHSVMEDLGAASPLAPPYGCEWDCEAEYRAEPSESPSMILSAAQGLDNAALALQGAADLLRRIASGSSPLLGRAPAEEVAR